MIQFQFDDLTCKNEKNWVEELSIKMKWYKQNQKYVFIGIPKTQSFIQYEIMRDWKTNQFKDLKQLKIFEPLKLIGNIAIKEDRTELFACCTHESYIYCWNWVSNAHKIYKTKPELSCIAFWVPDDNETKNLFVVIGFKDGQVEIWDWNKTQKKSCIQSPMGTLSKLRVNQKTHELFIYGGQSGKIEMWNLKTLTLKRTFYDLFQFNGAVNNICFLNYGQTFFASIHANQKIKIWDGKSEKSLFEFSDLRNTTFYGLIYSHDLNFLIPIGTCLVVNVWEMKGNKLKEVFKIVNPFSNVCHVIGFVNEEKQTQLIIATLDRDIFVFDLVLQKVVWERKFISVA